MKCSLKEFEMNAQELNELQQRNEERVKHAILELGSKYLLHPDNKVTKSKFKKLIAKQNKRVRT